MPPEYITQVMKFVNKTWGKDESREVTLEANPGTSACERFKEFRKAGINRLSLGVQSINPEELALLGRLHSGDEAVAAFKTARAAGFDNISLDLMYGIPGQSAASFIRSVEFCLNLSIEHLSAYTLSLEEGTPLARAAAKGELPAPDPDLTADQYESLIEIMCKAGFRHYELTNYACKERESRHNLTYWKRGAYLGVGVGSHSFDGEGCRWWNVKSTESYIQRLTNQKPAIEGQEELTEAQRLDEILYLGLRIQDGLSLAEARLCCRSLELEHLLKKGWMECINDRIRVNESKWLLLDEIIIRLRA